eukprot:455254-Pelagomonas_calceolata.AAC.2
MLPLQQQHTSANERRKREWPVVRTMEIQVQLTPAQVQHHHPGAHPLLSKASKGKMPRRLLNASLPIIKRGMHDLPVASFLSFSWTASTDLSTAGVQSQQTAGGLWGCKKLWMRPRGMTHTSEDLVTQ